MSRVGSIKQVTLALNGVPDCLGTIEATTTGVDNSNTGTPFTIFAGGPGGGTGVALEVDADVFVSFQRAGAITPPATTASFKLTANTTNYFVMKEDRPYIIARTASGTANVKVHRIS